MPLYFVKCAILLNFITMGKFNTKPRFYRSRKVMLVIVALLYCLQGVSQKNAPNKYPSLFWEISGNGLKKPSYLFGTMHVSNKMVFHLSDSFYYAMRNVDAVALELNPDVWQGQMVNLDRLKQNYSNFVKAPGDDLLTENSFRIKPYDDELKIALSTEPTVVNNLLYRSYKAREDFEENTFLDMYIFQTGKKMGKRSAGVEDFYETEKIVLQAYADMATEKNKKQIDTDGESMGDITKKIQEAYRRGDLDLMDSLDIMTERSIAFRENFLYKRNEVQANSIDTIVKKSSLFVGVGAAHLPGPRGVIELLRKMGYHLRPIKMTDRDAAKKEETDKLKVAVAFAERHADDGFYSVDMPGPLFKMTDEFQGLDRRQYSDMSNGSYYLVTRINTHAAFIGQSEEQVIKKVDSMLYENIPGKIVKKLSVEKNGYHGFDITNKTRTGDLQRYNIFITPFEILVFKMSGKESYVEGEEANHFFSSIRLKKMEDKHMVYTPAQGGFSVKIIHQPKESMDGSNSDGIDRWEYEAMDKTTGDAYLILKKMVYNFKFLDQDTFDLKLIEESFRSPDFFSKQLQRRIGNFNGYPMLDVKEKMKDGSFVTARYIIKGPQYFVIAARSKNEKRDFSDYFNSFHFAPYNYTSPKVYTDTFMHFIATTPVAPDFDEDYRAKLEQVSKEVAGSRRYANYNSYWPKTRNAVFRSDSTGEMIGVSIQPYPKYFYVRDTAKFWTDEMKKYTEKSDLLLYSKDSFLLANGTRGLSFVLRDSGSSRTINRLSLLQGNYLFNLVTMGDTMNVQSSFIHTFFDKFEPGKKVGRSIFRDCLDNFFTDLFSKDSSIHAKAVQDLSNVYYGEKGVPKIMNALQKLSPKDYDYLIVKSKLIAELGYIKDSANQVVVDHLKRIYERTADTSIFQNEVIEALARHKTTKAIALFKELILQDPAVFDRDFGYTNLFERLEDSLQLAASLYPEILQLTSLEDYKEPVTSLLVRLVDSGFIKAAQYSSFFNKIYFDAKIALKKQQGKEEKKLAENKMKDDGDDENEVIPVKGYTATNNNEALNNYATLLIPFYDSNATVPKFFDKLLRSKEDDIVMNTALLLLRNKKPLADSVLFALAAKDKTRGLLFEKMEKINRLDKFPSLYKTQLAMARSYLVADKNYAAIDSIVYVSKQTTAYDRKRGTVYFFKYRVKKQGDWKIGISGLQPENLKDVSSDDKLCLMTDKKIKEDIPVQEQFQEQLKKILFNFHKSARNFFETDTNGYRFKRRMAEED
ncbi:MAG: lipoprotein [Ferruginibacter sp.]|nr:lipoprotein [Ferruginibacter sp.]